MPGKNCIWSWGSLVLPRDTRRDLKTLRLFLEHIRSFAETDAPDPVRFNLEIRLIRRALAGEKTDNPIIEQFAEMARRKRFNPIWVEDFLGMTGMDVVRAPIIQSSDEESYACGLAGSAAFAVAATLDMPRVTYPSFEAAGRAFYYLDCLRFLPNTTRLSIERIPANEWRTAGLADLSEEGARRRPLALKILVQKRLELFARYNQAAQTGLENLPARHRLSAQIITDMYSAIAKKIARDPLAVYDKNCRPNIWVSLFILNKSIFRELWRALKNSLA